MGWVPSPAIGQRTCRVILEAAGLKWGLDAVCWIDNILLTAESLAELDIKLSRFNQVCQDLRVTYRIEDKGQVLDYIGLTLDLHQQTYTLQKKFQVKFQDLVSEALAADSVSYKQLQRLTGCCTWFFWSTRRSFLGMRHLLQALSFQTAQRAKQTKPDALPPPMQISLQTPVTAEIRAAAQMVGDSCAMPFARGEFPPLLPVMMTTDASEAGGAVVFSMLDQPYKVLVSKFWPWATEHIHAHINVLELRCLEMALDVASDVILPHAEPATMKWNSDSMVAIQVFNKMYSRSPPLAELLVSIQAKLKEMSLVVQPAHVPTDENIADRPSRIYM